MTLNCRLINERVFWAAKSLACGIHSGFPICCALIHSLFVLFNLNKKIMRFWYRIQKSINGFEGYGLHCPFHILTRNKPIVMNWCSCDHINVVTKEGRILDKSGQFVSLKHQNVLLKYDPKSSILKFKMEISSLKDNE